VFVLADDVEAEVIAQIRVALGDGLAARLARADDVAAPDVAELGAAITRDESALVQLGRDLDDGLITRAEWLARRERVNTRLRDARAQLAEVDTVTDLAGFADAAAFDEAWEAASFERRRAAILACVHRVVVAPAMRGRNRFDPDRLAPEWRA
jgi:hypothetical protein